MKVKTRMVIDDEEMEVVKKAAKEIGVPVANFLLAMENSIQRTADNIFGSQVLTFKSLIESIKTVSRWEKNDGGQKD